MDLSTILGIVSGFGFVLYAIAGGGAFSDFLDVPSMMIVFGGTIGSVLISFPMNDMKKIVKLFKIGFFDKKIDAKKTIKKIIDLSYTSKRKGLLSLESEIEDYNNAFLKKGVLLIVDGTDPEMVREILEMEVVNLEKRHEKGQNIIGAFGKYAPAFGMVGTLIGLIKMLTNLNDSDTLGPSMAIALVTTFYGALLANVLFNPLANKLKLKSELEIMEMDMLIEGILSIQSGESPYIIEEKLNSFLNSSNRDKKDENEDEEEAEIREGVQEV